MTASGKLGGGFFIGMIYGVIASGALYLVLSFLFPLNPAPTQTAPDGASAPAVMESAGAEMSGQGAGSGAGPVAPDAPVVALTAPEAGSNDTIAVGGTGDAAPAAVETAPIAESSSVSAPVVATESAAVPEIGLGTSETAVQEQAVVAPVENNTEIAVQEQVSTPASAPSELAASTSGPAIEVFAAPFSGDTTKPLLAIVLEDTLETSLQPLVDTGKPFSLALRAGADARASAQAIRENGFEVVAMIPDGTSRTEGVSANITRFMGNVPVAVALIDSPESGLMLNRESMQEILDTTAPSGLGIIAFSRNGELIARLQAEEAGMLYGSALQINESFDEDLIIQALNQAAFVARTNERAIVFAKTSAATINAITRWLISPQAQNIEIVPVSVVLQRPAN